MQSRFSRLVSTLDFFFPCFLTVDHLNQWCYIHSFLLHVEFKFVYLLLTFSYSTKFDWASRSASINIFIHFVGFEEGHSMGNVHDYKAHHRNMPSAAEAL